MLSAGKYSLTILAKLFIWKYRREMLTKKTLPTTLLQTIILICYIDSDDIYNGTLIHKLIKLRLGKSRSYMSMNGKNSIQFTYTYMN